MGIFKFVRFSLSALIPSETSALLKIFTIAAVNSLGESGSPCLTPPLKGNLSVTKLSK